MNFIKKLLHSYYDQKLKEIDYQLTARVGDLAYLEDHRQTWFAGDVDWIIYHDEIKQLVKKLEAEKGKYSIKWITTL